MNQIMLIGRITNELEPKYTQQGTAVVKFGIAVDRDRKNAQGEKETDFINCVVFGKAAEFLTNYAGKGKLIAVSGRLRTGSYTTQDGKKVYTTDVVAEKVQILQWDKQPTTNQQTTDNDGFMPIDDQELPF